MLHKNYMTRITIILFCLFPIGVMAQQGFTVNIKLDGIGDNKVRAISLKQGRVSYDTLPPQSNGIVVWKGLLEEPQLVRLEVLDSTLSLVIGKAVSLPPPAMFLLTNTTVNITGNAKEIFAAKVSSTNEEVMYYEKFRKDDVPNTREIWTLQKEQHARMISKDTAGTAANNAAISLLRKKNQAIKAKFIDENPKAFASILVLQSMSLQLTPDAMEAKYENLDAKYKNSLAGVALKEKIEGNKSTAIGKPVIPFAQIGHTGTMVDIATLKGKIVIIDFWGSWCVPCRKSHPDMKKLYKKYNSQGVEIIGIASETAKTPQDRDKAWRKAIAEDGVDWLHVMIDPDVNDLAKSYDIGGYPTKFLIDQHGKFVLRLLGNQPNSHEMLAQKIEELLKK
jgi:thiol-disulfide isomerase/thioredoxin